MRKSTKTSEVGAPSARTALVEATEQLICDEGFAAVTSRSVAAKAGVKAPLLHYYFKSMDDLLVEVFRRGAEADLARLAAAGQSDDPLRNMWKLSSDPASTRFVTEFMALANHVERVRTEITRYAEERRRLQAENLARLLEARQIDPQIPPLVIVSLMENVVRGMALETALGMSLGHQDMEAFVETCLKFFEEGGGAGRQAEAAAAKPPRRARMRRVMKGAPPRRTSRRG